MRHEPSFNTTLPANGIEDTGPPESMHQSGLQHLRDIELCNLFLDVFTMGDLTSYVIEESNNDPTGASGIMMTDLVTRLRGNTDVNAVDMLRLLQRLGLELAGRELPE
jgi:hypothetical protein